ncbi:sister chromatid cohesion 1 protein 1-like [Papaver somniferum]|uniref:sister chromatid cohesion 1 protein 1-like n=1 Tax=Papaver somniferum TaxID=3469 RepID=UPI000E6FAC6A|nr:sister chromatid cohesion 1 protein 1-like [Papaver somniferum]
MFYSHQLLARKAPLGQIWMAATLHAKINRRKLDKLNLVKICEEILNPSVPMALRLSGILMGGVVIVYERKVKLLLDDVSRLLVEINEAWKVKTVRDPNVLPKGKNQAKYEKVTMTKNNDPVTMDTAEIEQSLNFSNHYNADDEAGYFTMRLDRIDEPFTNEENARDPEEDQKHHQADRDNITLFDPFDSNQPEQHLFNRFERFDIEGDEDMNANFTSHEHSQMHTTLIPSPPPEIPEPVPMEIDDMRNEHPEGPEPQNNQQADERRDDVQQVQEDDVKPVIIKGNTRRRKTVQLAMDFEPIIGGSVYQSWLQDASNLVGRKKRAKSITRMKIAQLMDIPPVALVMGLAGKYSTEIYYPKPLLDLYMRSIQIRPPRDSPAGNTSGPQPPEPVSPIDGNPMELPDEDPQIGVRTRSKQRSTEKQMPNHPVPAEDFQSGVESRSKQPSIEKQMQMPNLDNFEFPVNEASMMFTPGHSGDNERSAPSSGSGNGFLNLEPEVQLHSGSRKRHSSRHSGGNLASVAEDKIWDLPEPDFKFRRFSENGFLHENETLVETGPTPTQHPPADQDQPMDKITDTIRMHLKTHFETPGASQVESLDQLASGADRKKAAQLFYQTLVLATFDHLKVQQTVAYGEILISKGPKM